MYLTKHEKNRIIYKHLMALHFTLSMPTLILLCKRIIFLGYVLVYINSKNFVIELFNLWTSLIIIVHICSCLYTIRPVFKYRCGKKVADDITTFYK